MGEIVSLGSTLLSMLRDVLPIMAILFSFQVLVLRKPVLNPTRVAIGLVFVVLGLTLFLRGLQLALFPLGRLMAEQLTAPHFILDGAIGMLTSVGWADCSMSAFPC